MKSFKPGLESKRKREDGDAPTTSETKSDHTPSIVEDTTQPAVFKARKVQTAEDKAHLKKYGLYGYLRTKDCTTCNGTGDHGCEDCVCGSCGGERHDCNACDNNHKLDDEIERPYTFGDELFTYEYIDEATRGTAEIVYCNVRLLDELFGQEQNDLVEYITLSLIKGTLRSESGLEEKIKLF